VKYKGEPTRLTIGARNVIREQVSIHPGTRPAAEPRASATTISCS
jgi:acyl-[acyl carrier protein]--UDP-N-acetylglucosamine O-acyltransferase